jgi:cytochrome P450
MAIRDDSGFFPAAIKTPETQLPYFKAMKTMFDNPMEGWPRHIYEQEFYVPSRRDFPTVYVCEPNALRAVLVEKAAYFPKAPVWLRVMRPMLGRGILTAEGAHWRWQRQAAAASFQPSPVLECAPAASAAARRTVTRWLEAGECRRDIAAEMTRITFEVILDTIFDGHEANNVDAMSAAFAAYVAELGRPSPVDLFGAPEWIRRFITPKAMAAVDYMRTAADNMIARRRASPPRDDLIGRLMEATDPQTGRAMSDVDLRNNVLTFLAGGHETTALALTWSIYLLSNDQPAQAKVAAEVARFGDDPLTASHLTQLPFTKQVVQEALRLFPPVAVMTRVCQEECDIPGRRIKRGEIVVIPIYALHRHRLYWTEPDRFDPDRFSGATTRDCLRYIYMPFGGGQRVCLGSSFAIMEATLVLAELVRRIQFAAISGYVPRPLMRITMRPEQGMPTLVSARANARQNKHSASLVEV